MIFRTEKNKNYVSIHKGFLTDTNLSFRAKGLMAYCLSRVDDWEFHVSHLQTVSTEGRDAVYNAIKELIKFGYIVRQLSRTKGKFEKGKYIIYETPQLNPVTENPDTVEPVPEKPYTVKPDPVNPPLVSNDIIVSNDNNKKPPNPQTGEAASAAASGSSSSSRKKKEIIPKTEVIPSVWLSVEELSKLQTQFGASVVTEMLTILSNYKQSSGRNYKSDYHAMIGWVQERYYEKKTPNTKSKLSLPGDGKIDGPDALWRKKKL